MSEELPATTVLHDKVHTLLILEAGQQLDHKGELHQPQHIPLSPQMLCLLHTLRPFRLMQVVCSQVKHGPP